MGVCFSSFQPTVCLLQRITSESTEVLKWMDSARVAILKECGKDLTWAVTDGSVFMSFDKIYLTLLTVPCCFSALWSYGCFRIHVVSVDTPKDHCDSSVRCRRSCHYRDIWEWQLHMYIPCYIRFVEGLDMLVNWEKSEAACTTQKKFDKPCVFCKYYPCLVEWQSLL